jgi:hypothetical protein
MIDSISYRSQPQDRVTCRNTAAAGGKPNRKMAIFSKWSSINIAFVYHKRLERLLGADTGITELGNCVICYESFVFLFIVCTIKEGTAIPKPIQPNNKGIT